MKTLTRKLSSLVGLLLLLVAVPTLLVGCSSSGPLHVAVAADTALTSGLHQLKTDEARAYATGLYAKDAHDRYLKVLLQADTDALAITDGIDAWRSSGSNPATVPAIVSSAKAGLQQILTDLAAVPSTNGFIVSLKAVVALLS